MDQRELEGYVRSLQKAVVEKTTSDVITIMEKLKADVVATEELLRVCLFSVLRRRILYHSIPVLRHL